MSTTEASTPPVQRDGEDWLSDQITGHLFGGHVSGSHGNNNKPATVPEDTVFYFPYYGRRKVEGPRPGRHKVVIDVVGVTVVEIPAGTSVTIYRGYHSSHEEYVATFFIEGSHHVNVFGHGTVRRRDLRTRQLEPVH